MTSHLDPPADGQAVIFLKGLLEVFYSELSNLATVLDNFVRYHNDGYSLISVSVSHARTMNIPVQHGHGQTRTWSYLIFVIFLDILSQ